MYAWEGSNETPDHTRFNLAYWKHYDRMMNALHRRGLVAHVFMRVYNKAVKWPANNGPEDELFYRWLVARYGAYPNVIWDVSKEAQYEKDVDYKIGRLKYMRANLPSPRLLTVHDDRAVYDRGAYDEVADFRSDQQHKNWRDSMLDHRRRREWPVINTEYGYEHGPGGLKDRTYNQVQAPEEVCRRAWEVYTAGGSGVYYYTYTAWDVLRVDDTPPGYAYFKHLHDFLNRTSHWKLKPVDGLTSDGYCLADPGREYVVFLNKAAPFTLKLDGVSEPLKAEWCHPFTGERRDGGKLNGGTAELKPPAEWADVPVALHVGERRDK
jgi:hypothetical protein